MSEQEYRRQMRERLTAVLMRQATIARKQAAVMGEQAELISDQTELIGHLLADSSVGPKPAGSQRLAIMRSAAA